MYFNLKDELKVASTIGATSHVTKLAGYEFTEHIIYSESGNLIGIRGLNVKNGALNLSDVKYVDKSNLTKLSRSKLCKGDIVYTYVGTIGNAAIIAENNRFYLAPNVALIRCKSILPEYLFQVINTDSYLYKVVMTRMQTSSQPALSMDTIRKLPISYPDIKIQASISQMLSQIDNLINTQSQVLSSLLLVKKFHINNHFKNSELNEDKKVLSEIIYNYDKRTTIENQYIQITSSKKGIFTQEEYFNTEVIKKSTIGSKVVPKGYFTYRSMSDTGCFTFNIQNRFDKSMITSAYPVFYSKLNPEYMLLALNNSPEIKKQIKIMQEGATRTSLSFTKLQNFTITLPTEKEISNFSLFSSQMDNFIIIIFTTSIFYIICIL